MQTQNKYKVSYQLNAYELKMGETILLPEKKYEIETSTDDMNYLFADIIEMHRNDRVSGLKIMEVKRL